MHFYAYWLLDEATALLLSETGLIFWYHLTKIGSY